MPTGRPRSRAEIDTAVARAKNGAQSRSAATRGPSTAPAAPPTRSSAPCSSARPQGLSNSADAVVRHGRKSLEGQKQEFAAAQAAGRATGSPSTIEKRPGADQPGRQRLDPRHGGGDHAADRRPAQGAARPRSRARSAVAACSARWRPTPRPPHRRLPARAGGDKATSYANVRGRDVAGPMLQQAQTDAAMQMLAGLPAFELDLPSRVAAPDRLQLQIGDGRCSARRDRAGSARRSLLATASACTEEETPEETGDPPARRAGRALARGRPRRDDHRRGGQPQLGPRRGLRSGARRPRAPRWRPTATSSVTST